MQGYTEKYEKETGDGTILILPWAYSSITQGTWAFVTSTSCFYNGYFYNSTTTAGDQINYAVYLSKGAYQFNCEIMNYVNGPNLCLLLLDSVVVASFNTYSHDNTAPYWHYMGGNDGIPVSTSGLKTLGIKVVGTNYDNGLAYLIFSLHMYLRRID